MSVFLSYFKFQPLNCDSVRRISRQNWFSWLLVRAYFFFKCLLAVSSKILIQSLCEKKFYGIQFQLKGKDGYFPLQHGLDSAPLDDFCAEEKRQMHGCCLFLCVFFAQQSKKAKTNARQQSYESWQEAPRRSKWTGEVLWGDILLLVQLCGFPMICIMAGLQIQSKWKMNSFTAKSKVLYLQLKNPETVIHSAL